MEREWKSFSLAELFDFSSGLSKPRTEFGFGHGFLSFKDVFYNYFCPPKLEQLVNSNEKEQQSCSIKRGDVFLTRTSETMDELGMSCVALQDYDSATFNGFTKRLRPKSPAQIIPEYAGYYFRSPSFRREVTAMSSLSTRASLNNEMLGRLKMVLPPPKIQENIGSILKALDDKIELNRRMNATLEAMARALFQSWFVDFDPVRAKLDGRQPVGMDEATSALFPDSFDESELAHIPKGWTVGIVGDLVTFNRVAVNPGDFPMEIFDHFSLPAFDNGRTPKAELGSAIMSNKFIVTPNSVLLSKLNPHIPRIWLPDLHASRRSVCSTEFMVACSKPDVSREYLFSLFTSSAFVSVYGTLVTGTTGSHQRIRPESVLDMKIVIPPAPLIRAFTDTVKPMFARINRNTEQSLTLATLRDTLLPKLLSGELSATSLKHED